ncbi:uncharacterized protein K452DRAFT_258539, partial [Aplosporella prunicola CBS 121167]
MTRPETASTDTREIGDDPSNMPIFNNIRATHAPPEIPACVLQLYYGSSSNFSFLQHLHSHLSTERPQAGQSEGQNDEVQDGEAGIDTYKYRGIVFDNVSDPRQPAPLFLRYSLAKSFLDKYLTTVHCFIPCLDAEQLTANFEQLYGTANPGHVGIAEKALVVIAMAMGARSTEHDYWRKTLLKQARTEAEQLLYVVNMKAVQVSLLLAHCEFGAGHPNASHICLGNAVTKSLAAGLHREGSAPHRSNNTRSEASSTMWNLFVHESINCFVLGRPYMLSRDDIGIPAPERPSAMGAIVRLCMIIRRTHQMYNRHDTSINAGLRSAYSIRHSLLKFSATVKEDLNITIGGTPDYTNREILLWHVIYSYLYYYTMLLAFRPFLLLYVQLKKRAEMERDEERQKYFSKESLLFEAGEYCISAAKSTVLFAELLISSDINLQALCNHGFFLETACFVLVMAAIHDKRSSNQHIAYISRGLDTLRKLIQREPIRSIVSALEQMLQKVKAAVPQKPQVTELPVAQESREDVVRNQHHPEESWIELRQPFMSHNPPPDFEASGEPVTGAEDNSLDTSWPTIDW